MAETQYDKYVHKLVVISVNSAKIYGYIKKKESYHLYSDLAIQIDNDITFFYNVEIASTKILDGSLASIEEFSKEKYNALITSIFKYKVNK